jgi:histidyl-tRNA synthetase
MSNKLQQLRGTKDLLPEAFRVHDYIIKTAQKIGELYGYAPMSTPIIEYTKVFDRTLGDTSDVVSKEMYSFLDKSNDSISLRPEFTAGIIRSFISNSLHDKLPLKFLSSGPVFRYDRPQAGRQRQFHQFNFEYIGADSPYSDAETIKLASDILGALELKDNVRLEINSLGCSESRNIYQQKIFTYFNDYKNQLSEDSVRRLLKNPMRILDSKDEGDKILVQNAPLVSECYTDSARRYFDSVLKYLDLLNVKYIINQRIVRGLDYYCHTAFEFTTENIGSQSTLIGGGRYDGLAKTMGGPETPAIGFAAGIERLALMREYNVSTLRPVFIIPIGDESLDSCLILADLLRQNNIQTQLYAKGKIDKRLQHALNAGARYVIFIGTEEIANGKYKLKDLDKREEILVTSDEIIELIKQSPK